MLRRSSLIVIAAAVTAAAATTLSVRSDQQLGNVTGLSHVEQSVNTEPEPSGWIALPLCAVSVVFSLRRGASFLYRASILSKHDNIQYSTQLTRIYNSIAQLRYYHLF